MEMSDEFENDSLEENDDLMELGDFINNNKDDDNADNDDDDNDDEEKKDNKNNQVKNKNPFLNNKSLKAFPTGIIVKNSKREKILDYRYLIKMKNINFGRMKIKDFKEAKKRLELEKNIKSASKINVGSKMNNIKNQLKVLWNKVEEIDENNVEFIKSRPSIPNFGTPLIDCTIEEDSLEEENSADSLENLPAVTNETEVDSDKDFIQSSMTKYEPGTKIADYSDSNQHDSLDNDSLNSSDNSSKEDINSSEKSNNSKENKQDDTNNSDEESDIKLKIYKNKNENNVNPIDLKKQPYTFRFLCQVKIKFIF